MRIKQSSLLSKRKVTIIGFFNLDTMKYIVIIGDGMADFPLKKLGNKTCLQRARTPNMDFLASHGEVGRVRTIPHGFEPGSDVANLSILGYDPSRYYSGRAPIEAVCMGIRLTPDDVAFRCNLVSLKFTGKDRNSAVMQDYSAGHISTSEAGNLIRDMNKRLGDDSLSFYPGISYRHVMVWKKGMDKVRCTPPHDISGKRIGSYLPSGRGGETLRLLMEKSTEFLVSHPVNSRRAQKSLLPANSIWLWGQGKKVSLPEFRKKYNLKGALISAVDLTKGLGLSAGFTIIPVRGATGYIDTNYKGKANAALRALNDFDIVYLHVEAPDEAGHNGDIKTKIRAIEDIDSMIVGRVMKGIKKFKKYSILLLPDHYTPIRLKTHTDDPVPFVVYRSPGGLLKRSSGVRGFSENICKAKNSMVFAKGFKLMDYFVNGK
jgi:2,3-bisphosphoglycerate-independent phosphoglycerate mutase